MNTPSDPALPARPLPVLPGPGLGDVLGWRAFLVIACLFWAYQTLSAVLYAYGLGASIAADLGESPFAGAPARIIQYLALLPFLLAAYWRSLQLGWDSVGRHLGQLAMAVAFSVIAYPLLGVGIALAGEHVDKVPDDEWGIAWHLSMGTLTTWIASFSDFLVRYGFGLVLVTGVAVYKQLRDSAVQRTELERQWTSARLAALRMQLSPHTLFNLLNAIHGQIAWNPPAAQALVLKLADLLRQLLRAGEQDFVPLRQELAFARLYLDLQEARFGDRLTVQVAEPAAAGGLWVPSLILQPLVENAVTHGLAGHAGPVTVHVNVHADDQGLGLTVINSVRSSIGDSVGGAGPATAGFAALLAEPLHDARATHPADHLGLRNVRERLAVQFGDRARLVAGPDGPGRWRAEVRLPRLTDGPVETAR